MTNRYIRSTDGNDADNGTTWTLANATVAGSITDSAAGDTHYISDDHSESTNANVTLAFKGTLAAPDRVLCVDDSAEPPTALATTGVIATGNGAYSISVTGIAYIYGVTFNVGVGASAAAHFNAANATGAFVTYDNCTIALKSTSNSARLVATYDPVGSYSSTVVFKDCTLDIGNTSFAAQSITAGAGVSSFINCTISGNINQSSGIIFALALYGQSRVMVDGCDLSAHNASVRLTGTTNQLSLVTFRNCKLPDSWSGTLCNVPTAMGSRVEVYNCDSGDTNYRLITRDYSGDIVSDTGIYNDAGATDGTTRLSWKMGTTANAEYPMIVLRSPEIVQWNDTVGSSKTVTLEIVHNSQGSGANGVLNDDEIWLEIQYLGASGYPLALGGSDRRALLGTAAPQTTSSAEWTGDAAGWDTQKLEVSFTPQEKGYIHAVVCLAKASATVYVDPLLTVA